jgi:hypothetical protein
MNHLEEEKPVAIASAGAREASSQSPGITVPAAATVAPQTCPTCAAAAAPDGGATTSYIYAIGTVEARFPSPGVEKELAQATGRAATVGLTDRQALQQVISQRQNRYLARQLCWVLTIEGMETYILVPRDPADLDLLVEALRPTPNPLDLDTVIGTRGPIAPPQMCNGLMVPIVTFDQIYSFDRDALIKAIPRPEKVPEADFAVAAAELFDRVMQLTDNAGATDAHRALNYLALRYPAIYADAAAAFARNSALSSVYVTRSPLSGTRNIVEVLFAYTDRNTDVSEKFFVRVDVTEEFPFLVTKLSPFFDR